MPLITEAMFDPLFLAAYRSALFGASKRSSNDTWSQEVETCSIVLLEIMAVFQIVCIFCNAFTFECRRTPYCGTMFQNSDAFAGHHCSES